MQSPFVRGSFAILLLLAALLPASAAVLFTEDFEGFSNGAILTSGGNWTAGNADSLFKRARVTLERDGYFLELDDNQYLDFDQRSDASADLYLLSAGKFGPVTRGQLSFHILEPQANGDITVALGRDLTAGGLAGAPLKLVLNEGRINGAVAYRYGLVQRVVVIFNDTDTAWALVDGVEVAAQAYDVFVEGVLKIDDAPLAGQGAGINAIGLLGQAASTSPRSRMWFDNLELRTDVSNPADFVEQWEQDADARIAQLRTAPAAVRVVDAQGRPVWGASVRFRMERHAYRFGTAISDIQATNETAFSDQYRQAILDLFTAGVMEGGWKWPTWLNPDRKALTLATHQWLRDNGLYSKGHVLIWPGFENVPPSVQALITAKDAPGLQAAVLDHFTDILTTPGVKGQVYAWEVVNEVLSNHDVQPVLEANGYPNPVEQTWFAHAATVDPAVQLMINENNVVSSGTKIDAYIGQIQALVDAGAPLQGIGVQCHFRQSSFTLLPNPVIWWKRFERLAAFGLPMEVTEFDIFNDVRSQYVTWSENDEAYITRGLLKVAFSHPLVQSFYMWGFVDPQHWMNNAPLFNSDWSLTKGGAAWMDLVHGEWKTDTTQESWVDGQSSAAVVKGRYTVEVGYGGETVMVENVEVLDAGEPVEIQLSSSAAGPDYFGPWTELDGWLVSDALGLVWTGPHPWFYHPDFGWLYYGAGDISGFWWYHPEDGWIYGTRDAFPHHYSYGAGAWVIR